MTEFDDLDEQAEIRRLKQILESGDDSQKLVESTIDKTKAVHQGETLQHSGILSDDLLQEVGCDPSDILILHSKKKKPKQPKQVELSPQEIRQAKLLQKNSQRKLKQLEQRAEQKKKRAELYSKLQETAIDPKQMDLLESSASFTKKKSKQEKLKRSLKRERAGLELTTEEKDLLYVDRKSGLEEMDMPQIGSRTQQGAESATLPDPKKKRKDGSEQPKTSKANVEENMTTEQHVDEDSARPVDTQDDKPQSFAARMLASLATIKSASENHSSVEQKDETKEKLEAFASNFSPTSSVKQKDETKGKLEALSSSSTPTERYVPPTPTVVKTAASLGIQSKRVESKSRVIEIQRPKDVQAARDDLPVATMEFEVMDAIRNNDVTIVCGETGSGKSTQIPQFVYSEGLTQPILGEKESHFLIAVTQPRRVAAVSTAKRVCHEMGEGDGQLIRSKGGRGNLVGYQTRYENAGLGTDCHIKFMTDGILLQEIQSDLLLRKYSVIVLDEAHERNLNTDVLIGLLSAALPLRKKAAEEEGSKIVPLKLIIMSATLRVEDFTGNSNLFSSCQTGVVTIPGRTYPVTIHHSKFTELVNYEDEAFRKVCKIHRKLPNGGILVFLTGKQEIVRMVNRLQKTLCKSPLSNTFVDVHMPDNDDDELMDSLIPRDLDDEELDGDLFPSVEFDANDIEQSLDTSEMVSDNPMEGGIPPKALVLPLYSLLSADEQAKVFAPVPDGHRLIVITTNIAETSLTIPGITYVVDSGRQKCRNFNAKTGVSSFDIMWISKAAANQRSGRSGRTGPGHCYRLYSSSLFSRHMDAYALPEVLTRPLEDVVLAMKAMRISNVASFPFPTPPDKDQLQSALNLLADIGCLESLNDPREDGKITRLGRAVTQLPLGVRYGKILLVGAQAGVLDYIIPVVATMSESNPFVRGGEQHIEALRTGESDEDSEGDEGDGEEGGQLNRRAAKKWYHKGGDLLAVLQALGGYSYAGRGAGGTSEKLACKRFCEENGLNWTVMDRIQRMRIHLAHLAGQRLRSASGVAAKTGGIVSSMSPPDKLQERLLCQSIASGLLDHVAMLAPPGSIPGDHPFSLRSAYISCSLGSQEPLFMDRNSVLYFRDSRQLPQWVCYDSLLRKTHKDGTTFAVMKDVTPLDPSWLGSVASGSRLLRLAEPKTSPPPFYDHDRDAVMCNVATFFGRHGWEIPSVQVKLCDALVEATGRLSSQFAPDDSFRWFARLLLEGKVLSELSDLTVMLNDNPSLITRQATSKKAVLLVSALSAAGIDSAGSLQKHWSEVDKQFLFKHLKLWVKAEYAEQAKRVWISAVETQVSVWKRKGR